MTELNPVCHTFCSSKRFNFEILLEHFLQGERAAHYKDVVYISRDESGAFIFSYGVVVTWNMSHEQIKHLIDELNPFILDPFGTIFADEFLFSENNQLMRIHQDHIFLTSKEFMDKLAVSHGLAQSLKLSTLEASAAGTIDSMSHIPQNIAATGKSGLRRNEIAKMQGKLFIVEMDINLTFELLDTPDFFWEYPELEPLYEKSIRYLDVHSRIAILNKKLTVIRELFNMLTEEQNHKHSAVLEWIIIWLIAVEIVLFIYKEFINTLR